MVDHDVHRVTVFGQEVDCGAQQGFRTCSANARQQDQAGVNLSGSSQSAKISGIFRYKHVVKFNASRQDLVVRCTQAAEVPRMHGDVCAFGIESLADPG